MRTIIAGSRSINNYRVVESIIKKCPWQISTILSGQARGVDSHAIKYAIDYGIHHEEYPADWEHKGKAAGIIRNRFMAENADALIAIWDGKSVGTEHMICQAMEKRLNIYVRIITLV